MRGLILAAVSLGLLGCETSENPADGGFISGVAAINAGTYDKRIAEREAKVAAGLATQAELEAELARLNGDYSALKSEIIRLRGEAVSAGKRLSPLQQDKVNTILVNAPGGSTEEEKIANLRRAIADARALAAELNSLNS